MSGRSKFRFILVLLTGLWSSISLARPDVGYWAPDQNCQSVGGPYKVKKTYSLSSGSVSEIYEAGSNAPTTPADTTQTGSYGEHSILASCEYYVPGVADGLTDHERKIYMDLKGQMDSWRWGNVREGLAQALMMIRQSPSTVCKDAFTSNSFFLECKGPSGTKQIPWLMSSDLNPYFNKNIVTPEEEFSERKPASSQEAKAYSGYIQRQAVVPSRSTSRDRSAFLSVDRAKIISGASDGPGEFVPVKSQTELPE